MSDHDEKITATLEEPSPAVGQEPSSSPLLWLFPKRWRTRERLLVLKIDFLLLLWAFVAGLTKVGGLLHSRILTAGHGPVGDNASLR